MWYDKFNCYKFYGLISTVEIILRVVGRAAENQLCLFRFVWTTSMDISSKFYALNHLRYLQDRGRYASEITFKLICKTRVLKLSGMGFIPFGKRANGLWIQNYPHCLAEGRKMESRIQSSRTSSLIRQILWFTTHVLYVQDQFGQHTKNRV